MNNLLNYVALNSIFSFNKDFLSVRNSDIQKIPQKCFGAFISVKRSSSQTLKTWPEDIHGCIGNWKQNFNEKSKKDLFDIMVDVGYKACNNDSRKDYFKPIYNDSQAIFEVDFMMLPLLKINSTNGRMNNGEVFKNENYGIIVVNDSNTATYLPKVFLNKSWLDLKKELLKKADISKKLNTKFYAYKAKIHSIKIYELIKYVKKTIFNKFIQFNLKHYTSFVPYNVKNNKVLIDKSQYVRNIATLNDLLQVKNILKINDTNLLKLIKSNLDYYIQIMTQDKGSMRQASSFLLLALKNFNKKISNKNVFIKDVCNYLYDNLEYMDKSFELGEVCIALNEVCLLRTELMKIQKKMFSDLKKLSHSSDSIFRYNWESKFLYSLYKTRTSPNLNESIINHFEELLHRIINNFNLNESSETNYLAVTFEALSSLKIFIKNKKKLNKVKDIIFYIFYLLQKRYNKNGLYYFKSNNEARLDITGHIINGLLLY